MMLKNKAWKNDNGLWMTAIYLDDHSYVCAFDMKTKKAAQERIDNMMIQMGYARVNTKRRIRK